MPEAVSVVVLPQLMVVVPDTAMSSASTKMSKFATRVRLPDTVKVYEALVLTTLLPSVQLTNL